MNKTFILPRYNRHTYENNLSPLRRNKLKRCYAINYFVMKSSFFKHNNYCAPTWSLDPKRCFAVLSLIPNFIFCNTKKSFALC